MNSNVPPNMPGGGMPGTQKQQPRTTVDTTARPVGGGSSFKTPKNSGGGGIGHIIMKPIEWGAKSFRWLATPTKSGGGKYVMYALAIGCFGLSVENFYVQICGRNEGAQVRFIPKPGIRDGADIRRFIPIPTVADIAQNTFLTGMRWVGVPIPDTWRAQSVRIVWFDLRFYAALFISFGINAIEAMALRRVSLQFRERQLRKSQTTDQQVDSIVKSAFQQRVGERLETKVRKQQIKNYGNGEVVVTGVVIIGAYAFEFWSFAQSAAPGVPFVGTTLTALMSIFGPEVFLGLAKSFEEREDTD